MSFPSMLPIPQSIDSANFAAYMDAFLAKVPDWADAAEALAATMEAIAAGGAVSLQYEFSTTTTDADPGAGKLRLDNATQNTATTIRADLTGADGSDLSGVLALFDDSTSTNKGYLTIRHVETPTKWLIFTVSSVASPSGYKNISVTIAASSAASPFTNGDAILVDFTPTGDKGDAGAAGASGGISLVRSARTSNAILVEAYRGTLSDITGASTFTQTFTAAATLGSGWCCYYRNSGTGDVTLDPNGAEQIDGLTSFIMYPGECRLIQCTGTAFTSVVVSPFYRAFTATGTFTKPPGYNVFGGIMWSGGGSGQKTDTTSRGGGGGGCTDFKLPASTVGTTETITVGAGGTSVTADTTAGNGGGYSSIGSLVTVYGHKDHYNGGSVISGLVVATQGQKAVGYEGAQYCPNGASSIWGGASSSNDGSANSGSSVYGGAAGASYGGGSPKNPGTSIFGGNGGAASDSTHASPGAAPGGGGGASVNGAGKNSGAGGRGEVRIWGII